MKLAVLHRGPRSLWDKLPFIYNLKTRSLLLIVCHALYMWAVSPRALIRITEGFCSNLAEQGYEAHEFFWKLSINAAGFSSHLGVLSSSYHCETRST